MRIQRFLRGRLFTRLIVLGVLVGASLTATAQSTGIISGRVSNAATGVNLQGAEVRVQGTGFSASTGRGGVYRLTVPAGTHTVEVRYTGLDVETATINVTAGETVMRDFGLTAEIYQLSEFSVSGEREGNALAITLQRQAPNVKNVVSSDAFGSLAGNPADLLTRLPGVIAESVGGDNRYVQIRGMSHTLNNITIDGNRTADASAAGNRSYQFQTIGSDTIERIEVTKSPTPDMDADSIGGAVNMVSKSAFDRSPERRIGFSLGAIWRPTDERDDEPNRNYALSYSEVFGGKLGVSFNYGHRGHWSLIDISTMNSQHVMEGPAYTSQLQRQDFRNERTRWGGGLKLDYKLSDNSRFYLNATLNKHDEHSIHNVSNFLTSQNVATVDANGNFTNSGHIMPGYTEDVTEWRPRPNSRSIIQSQSTHKRGEADHLQLGGVHEYQGLDIDYDVYRSTSTTEYPGNATFALTARGIGLRIERTDAPFWPNVTQLSGPDVTDIDSYTQNLLTISPVALYTDDLMGVAFNVKKEFETAVPTWIKTGVRFREQQRDLNNQPNRWVYAGPDGIPQSGDEDLAQFVNPNVNYALPGGLFAELPFPTRANRELEGEGPDPQHIGYNIGSHLRAHPEEFQPQIGYNTQQALVNRQNFEETITAGYIMGNVELGRFSVLGGFRVENTEVWGEGAKQEVTPEERARREAWVGPVTDDELLRRTQAEFQGRREATGEYKKVFPGLHFKYEPFAGLIARASWATNIGRPAIGTLIPRTTVNYENETVVANNPSLKPQYADNFDLGVEYYFEPVGMLSAGVFLKEISNFIFTAGGVTIGSGPDNGFNGDYAGFELRTQGNGGWAKVKGFELAYQQQFTFLPGWMSGLGVFANYTRMDTEGDYGTGKATTELADFIPETGNLGLSYIRNAMSVRLQFNHQGRYLDSFNGNPAARQYRKARSALDIKTVYTLSRNFDLYLDVVNVTGEGDRVIEWGNGQPRVLHKMAPQFFFGINGRL